MRKEEKNSRLMCSQMRSLVCNTDYTNTTSSDGKIPTRLRAARSHLIEPLYLIDISQGFKGASILLLPFSRSQLEMHRKPVSTCYYFMTGIS